MAVPADPPLVAARPPSGNWFRRLAARLWRWRLRLTADPAFQARATRNPLLRPIARAEAARLYDLVAGFVYSQTLLALVDLDLLQTLARGDRPVEDLAAGAGIPPERMERLLAAGAALDLVWTDGVRAGLGPLGAAALGAPGVVEMIRHHALFYRDLADPVALLRGEADTALGRFWRYGRSGAIADAEARRYSALMAASQGMVAAEVLATGALRGVRHLMDVGGGTGAFLRAALAADPGLGATLFDLPPVAAEAASRLRGAGLDDRVRVVGGSFLDGPLPAGADAISLVRVLYDHDDPQVASLLARVFEALPPGGRVIVAEPMAGEVGRPSRAGDAYFGFYTLAMGTGRPRPPGRHRALLRAAGFVDARAHPTRQPFITGVVTARRP